MKNHAHHTYPDIIKRLKRANGHLNKVISMIEKEVQCLDVAQQLHAVSQAIHKAKEIISAITLNIVLTRRLYQIRKVKSRTSQNLRKSLNIYKFVLKRQRLHDGNFT